MIVIVDYGVGNINSLVNLYKSIGVDIKIAKTKNELIGATKIILPGVGSFDHAIKSLNSSGLRDHLDKSVMIDKVPVLGICVGMQMMAKGSEEGNMEGLNWIDAEVLKFDTSKISHQSKLPHMGWNNVNIIKKGIPLFSGLANDSLFYFLHSYYFKSNISSNVIAETNYGMGFDSAVNFENIFGVQFHPEKSHSAGEILLNNFYNL